MTKKIPTLLLSAALMIGLSRICENGFYINLVPKGLYPDVSFDPHMREVEGEAAEGITFFTYESINAFRLAARNTGLTRRDIEDVFYNNAAALFLNNNRTEAENR